MCAWGKILPPYTLWVLIYPYQICSFLHFQYVAGTHMKNAKSTNYVCIYLNNGGQKFFISFVLCVSLQYFHFKTSVFLYLIWLFTIWQVLLTYKFVSICFDLYRFRILFCHVRFCSNLQRGCLTVVLRFHWCYRSGIWAPFAFPCAICWVTDIIKKVIIINGGESVKNTDRIRNSETTWRRWIWIGIFDPTSNMGKDRVEEIPNLIVLGQRIWNEWRKKQTSTRTCTTRIFWKCLMHSLILRCVVSSWNTWNMDRLMSSFNRIKVTWEQKLQILHDVASAMSYLHHHQPIIIHGDLKCQNILIGYWHYAKISDFGMAQIKSISRSKSSHPGCGTLQYIAPEYLKDPLKKKSEPFDVYGFAISAWEIFSEKRPYSDCDANW